jgi:thiol-disulfide isomerase/thioredoxin
LGDDEGADSNNLFIDRYNFGLTSGSVEGFIMLEKEAFLNKINYFKNGMDSIAALYPNANESMLEQSNIQNNTFFDKLLDNYDQMHARFIQQRRTEEKLKKGNKAPDFSNYENYNGNTSSLSDFRGKYVYIDIWATWCRPCIAQFPYLKKLEKEFQGKNISFVSISTDDDRRSNGSWEKARDKWITMVRKRNLSGYQLWAGKDDARFSREYMITSIPRFILIDPEGNLIDSNAKSPADPALRELLVRLPGI